MGYLIQLNVYVVLNNAKKCRPYLFTKAFAKNSCTGGNRNFKVFCFLKNTKLRCKPILNFPIQNFLAG